MEVYKNASAIIYSTCLWTLEVHVKTHAAAQSACERCQQWMEVVHLVHALKTSSVQLDLVVQSAAVSAPQGDAACFNIFPYV